MVDHSPKAYIGYSTTTREKCICGNWETINYTIGVDNFQDLSLPVCIHPPSKRKCTLTTVSPQNHKPIHPWTIFWHRLLNSTFRNFVWDHRNPKERTLPTSNISQPSWASSLGRCSNHLQADREPDESSPRCPVISAARRGQTDLDMSCGLWGKFKLSLPTAFALKVGMFSHPGERAKGIVSWLAYKNYTLTPYQWETAEHSQIKLQSFFKIDWALPYIL